MSLLIWQWMTAFYVARHSIQNQKFLIHYTKNFCLSICINVIHLRWKIRSKISTFFMALTCLPKHFSCQTICSHARNLMWHITVINIIVRLNHNKLHATISIKITKQTFSSTRCCNINTSKYLCLFHFGLLCFVLTSSL